MELYYKLLIGLLKKDTYSKYYKFLDLKAIEQESPMVYKLYKVLDYLHSKVTDRDLTLGDFDLGFTALYPNEAKKEVQTTLERASTILEETSNALSGSNDNEGTDDEAEATQEGRSSTYDSLVEDVLAAIAKRAAATKLIQSALRVIEGNTERDFNEKLKDECEQYLKSYEARPTDDLEYLNDDLEDILAKETSAPGLRWRLSSLNKNLGPLRGGDFGFIFARPETGKTTLLASEVSYMAEQQHGKFAVWFNNEEKGNKVVVRIIQGSLGLTLSEIKDDPRGCTSAYGLRTARSLRFFDRPEISKSEVERTLARLPAGLVVFDQIDKIHGFDGEREDLRLGKIYQWARELAKRYDCPIIGVCQADGHAEGVKRLQMDHVANAKTSKQAEADWMLGIGRTFEPGFESVRYLSLCKNKLVGDDGGDETMRHGFWEVIIRPEIARYEDVSF